MRPTLNVLAALASLAAAACSSSPAANQDRVPVNSATGLRASEMGPVPALPTWADNPSSDAKSALGKSLFFDIRISGSGTAACGNCHLSTTDYQSSTPLDVPDRSYPKLAPTLPRNTPSLLNVVYARMLRWDGSYYTDLFDVAVLPYAEANMNLSHAIPANEVEVVDLPGAQAAMREKLLVEAPGYKAVFRDAFAADLETLTPAQIWRLAGEAMATYLRSVVSRDAAFDRWNAGDDSAMSDAAARGFSLFRGKAACVACHSGPLFSDFQFHNVSTALPGADGTRADEGRFKVTGMNKDRGAFLTPMLRSAALTSPYLHDGAETSIANVIRIKIGKRGGLDPNHDPLLDQIPELTDSEIDDLVQFVKALDGKPLTDDVIQPPLTFP